MSKFEARKAENSRYEEISIKARNPHQKQILSLLEAINSRLDTVEVKKSNSYYKENKACYSMLFKQFGDVPIETIKKADINSLLLDTSKSVQSLGHDNYKVNSMLRIFKALFNHAIEEYELDIKNPCVGIKPFSVMRKLKYIPPESDINAILELCDPEEQFLITFVFETACRINEAIRFSGADLFPDYIILYTRKSKNSDLVPRKIKRPDCLTGITLQQNERLFKRWTTRPKYLEDKVKELGQQSWNWHNLRHRKASIMSKEGVPLFDIMCFLGHSSLKTTQGYLQQLG